VPRFPFAEDQADGVVSLTSKGLKPPPQFKAGSPPQRRIGHNPKVHTRASSIIRERWVFDEVALFPHVGWPRVELGYTSN